MTKDRGWFVYIIETQTGLFYTGITTDIERRFSEHRRGRGAKFFRRDAPLRVVYQRGFEDRSAASREEHRIKSLSRPQKIRLIADKG